MLTAYLVLAQFQVFSENFLLSHSTDEAKFFVLSLENLIDTYKAVVDEEETKFKDWQGKEAVNHSTVNGSSNFIRNILF